MMRNRLAGILNKKYFPNGAVPTEADIACVAQRQLGHKVGDVIAVDNVRCKHGFTRAIVRFPVQMHTKSTAHSGMLRLTCPHLVKEIDKLEANGAIPAVNKQLESRFDLIESFNETNETWESARKDSVNIEEIAHVERVFGKDGAKIFFDSGIVGVTKGRTDDAKCLHAHVADFIMRGTNRIGEMALEELSKNGVDVNGCKGTKGAFDLIRNR